MSSMTRESQNTVATIWYKRGGVSSYDPVTYEPKLVDVCFAEGGESKHQDLQGVMIVPKSRYWFEFGSDIEKPRKKGDYISRGSHLDKLNPTLVETAEPIRYVRHDDLSLLGEIDDLYLET